MAWLKIELDFLEVITGWNDPGYPSVVCLTPLTEKRSPKCGDCRSVFSGKKSFGHLFSMLPKCQLAHSESRPKLISAL